MSTNKDNSNNDGEGKPKDHLECGSDEEEEVPEVTDSMVNAIKLLGEDIDATLLARAIGNGEVPLFTEYPPGATEKRKRDIDGMNVLAVNGYLLHLTAANLDEVMAGVKDATAGLDVAPTAAAPAPSRRAQQLLDRAREESAAFEADIQAQYEGLRGDVAELQVSDANQNEQLAVLTEAVAQQGEQIADNTEQIADIRAQQQQQQQHQQQQPRRRNPARGKGKGGKKK